MGSYFKQIAYHRINSVLLSCSKTVQEREQERVLLRMYVCGPGLVFFISYTKKYSPLSPCRPSYFCFLRFGVLLSPPLPPLILLHLQLCKRKEMNCDVMRGGSKTFCYCCTFVLLTSSPHPYSQYIICGLGFSLQVSREPVIITRAFHFSLISRFTSV